LTSATQAETVKAVASKLVYTTSAQTLTAGVTSGTITVQLDDSYGNVASATSAQTVNLTTSSTTAGQFLNAGDLHHECDDCQRREQRELHVQRYAGGKPGVDVGGQSVDVGDASRDGDGVVGEQAGVHDDGTDADDRRHLGNDHGAVGRCVRQRGAGDERADGEFDDEFDGGAVPERGGTSIASVTIASGSSSASFKYTDTLAEARC